ncbi:Hypothetical predicted protein [Cloeon dipterum]|uniref:Protein RRP5 homolog n=1 Tax=Cloeon dipterum TaxID=197152 RepID=A0A8S1E576_9INSE|nr:Hypothetical predicted protein [Cloeon dipterum]
MEPSFPRGGKEKLLAAAESEKSQKRKQNDDLFGKSAENKGKKKSKSEQSGKKKAKGGEIDLSSKLNTVDCLTYKVLSEGMLVLGCVREVHSYYLNISLPGQTLGRVPISAISRQYTEALNESDDVPSLEELFYVGQHVVTKVIAIAMEGNYYQVTLSLCPDDVNSEVTQSAVKEGMVLTGALSSIEDHGYLIDFGVANVRAFMKNNQAEAFKVAHKLNKLTVGQLVRCLVTKATSSTVQVTADPAKVNAALIPPSAGINPHLVIPGMKFEVTSVEQIANGALIKWLKYDGYVRQEHFPNPSKTFESQFAKMKIITATVLYSVPLVRTVYLTMQEPAPFALENRDTNLGVNGVPSNCNIALGEVIDSAEVMACSFRGLVLKLKKSEFRGMVGLSQMPSLQEEETLKKMYPPKSHVQCRVLKYDVMEKLFICTMKKDKINEKILSVSDVKPGSIIQCLIVDVRKKELFLEVNKHPDLKARVPSIHLSDSQISDISKRFATGQRVKGRALGVDTAKNVLLVTLKPSLVNSTKPILSSYTNIPMDTFFEGVVYFISSKFYLVSFYNGVTGKLSVDDIPSDLNKKFTLGQTVNVRVDKVFPDEKLKLSMESYKEHTSMTFEVGREYSATVDTVLGTDIKLRIAGNDTEGFGIVPKILVSTHASVADFLMKSLSPGDKVKATCLFNSQAKNIFSIDQELSRTLKSCLDEELKVHSLVPGLVKSVGKSGVVIRTLSKTNEGKIVFAFQRALADEPIENKKEVFTEGQAILVRVENVASEIREHKVAVQATGSTKLMDVCPYGVDMGGLSFADNYVQICGQIHQKLKKNKHPIASYEPGQMVNARIKSINAGWAEVKLDGGVTGFISNYHSHGAPLEVNQDVHAIVIWVDQGSQRVHLSIRPDILKQIHKDQASCPKPKLESTQRGEVIFSTNEVAVVVLKGQCKGLIACAPVKKHINDLTPIHNYVLGTTCKFVFKSLDRMIPVCVNKRDLPNKGKKQKAVPGSLEWKVQKMEAKKRAQIEIKKEVDSDFEVEVKRLKVDTDVKLEEDVKEERQILDAPDEDEITEVPKEEIQVEKKKTKKKGEPQTLQVEGFVWDPVAAKPEEEEESSSDESDQEEVPKKMTLAERRAQARKEEEKLVIAEQKLMDEDQSPQSVDEFDRLLMASPDSSIVWVQYMAFHLQATEIEKARAVARKAINTISFREEQEKLNVWVALLNLENMYGTPETLEKTLQEAVQLNDAQKVYTQMLKIFSDSNKIEEGNSLFDTMLRKFRADKDTWIQGGTFYYKTNQVEKGRHLLQRALRSLENRDHVDVICRFAHLENKHGSPERCQTLFEHILTTFPKRTDVWSSYVDLMVKSGNIDAARSIMERAITQKLPVRKMKVIFKKYLEFAQQHGSEEEVAAVKEKAQQFVLSVASNLPLGEDSD